MSEDLETRIRLREAQAILEEYVELIEGIPVGKDATLQISSKHKKKLVELKNKSRNALWKSQWKNEI